MTVNKLENADFLNEGEEDDDLSSINNSFEKSESQNEALVFNVMELHFSVGEIFWTMTSGKEITLFHPGDWIRKDYLSKFIAANKTIEIKSEVNDSFCIKGLALFESLKNAEEESEKAEIRSGVIEWLSSGYWHDNEEVGLLDLVFVFEKSFYEFSQEEENKLFEMSADIFKRASVVSGLLVSLAIVMGYTDYNLLKDLYHLSFLFDVSLDETVLSTNIINALEKERLEPQSWDGNLTQAEIEVLKSHSQVGVDEAFKYFEDRISNPGLLHFIETHHERINGEGFPLGLVEGEISDLEGLIIFINNRFPYSDLEMKFGDATSFIRNLMEKSGHVDAVLTNRIKKMITSEFENSELEHSRYLEVSGI